MANHPFRYFVCLLCLVSVSLPCTGSQKWHIRPSAVIIVLNSDAPEPLQLAVHTLARDMEKVTGYKPEIVPDEASVRDGTVALIVLDRETSDSLRTGSLPPLGGFESHRVKADRKSGRIWLDGADMRGAIYAVYTFDERVMGVPPLWYWCSWQPERNKRISLASDLDLFFDSPQVRFRSWLANDSDLWSVWIRKSRENREAVFETILRLKLNTLECGGLAYPGIPGDMPSS